MRNSRLILPLLLAVFILLLGGTTFAGSWWIEYGTGPGRTPAPSNFPQMTTPPWGNPNTPAGQGTPSPPRFFYLF